MQVCVVKSHWCEKYIELKLAFFEGRIDLVDAGQKRLKVVTADFALTAIESENEQKSALQAKSRLDFQAAFVAVSKNDG